MAAMALDGAGGGGSTRHHRWRGMMQQGIRTFIEEQPSTFQRRARRGIPMEFRWEAWKAAVHMEERYTRGRYQELLQTKNEWTRLIEIDIPRTFPEMPMFDGEQQQSLLRVLEAYANLNPDVGYCQGMNFVAGLLLMVAQKGDFRETPRLEKEEETFWMFVCLMEDRRLSGFYKRRFPLLRRYLFAFDELVADHLPELQSHFAEENVQHAVYLHQWFLTLFINCVPLPMVLVFWDAIVCTGLETLLGITLSLLTVLKGVLMDMQFEDIVRFFKTMRAGALDSDAAAIGQMVVARGPRLPPQILAQLRPRHSRRRALPEAESALGTGAGSTERGRSLSDISCLRVPRSADHEATIADDGCSEDGSLATPRSAPASQPPSPRPASAATLGCVASDGGLTSGMGAMSLGSFLSRQLSEMGRDLPQGMLNWWEDARDNLQRVGLAVPPGGSRSRFASYEGTWQDSPERAAAGADADVLPARNSSNGRTGSPQLQDVSRVSRAAAAGADADVLLAVPHNIGGAVSPKLQDVAPRSRGAQAGGFPREQRRI